MLSRAIIKYFISSVLIHYDNDICYQFIDAALDFIILLKLIISLAIHILHLLASESSDDSLVLLHHL